MDEYQNYSEEFSIKSKESSILTKLTPALSEEFNQCAICCNLYTESNSAIIEDDTFYFRDFFAENYCKERFEKYTAKVDDFNYYGYDKYKRQCWIFNEVPVRALKKTIEDGADLDLNSYGVENLGMKLIFDALVGPPQINLKKLDLSYCVFSEKSCITLAEFIEDSQHLRYINLTGSQIGEQGGIALAEGLASTISLETIILKNCNLNDLGGVAIIRSLKQNETCRYLDLMQNKLSTKSGIEISILLTYSTPLEDLRLGWNELFEDQSVNAIAYGLKFNSKLKKLDLSWNGLSGVVFGKALNKALKVNYTIEEIDLKRNGFSRDDGKYISFAMKNSLSLKKIDLEGNPWTLENIERFIKCVKPDKPLRLVILGYYLWITKDHFKLIVKQTKAIPDLKFIYKGILSNRIPEPVNFRNIIMDRCKFLAMKPKKKKLKRNMGHFMWKLKENENLYPDKETFEKLVTEFKLKLDSDLKNHLAEEFTTFVKNKKFITLNEMADYYLKRHPTDPPPVVPPKVKKRKGKRKKKDKGKKK